ncbi:hypothetical protein B0H16DRAFT_1843275 [Mycena metata]|uniref:Uncharacterized protein n=1 Tax=Mycena metata TaxID=1033252 RepID=A0AAD7IUU1_9AGAR|nr:hypothetical protein B0H16DRAFT_1843275 [Mycena metata]
MDNASNNTTFMQHFSVLLAEAGILDFDAKDNYIRCFAHIINLCAQATIKAMEKEDSHEIHSETDTETESDDNTPGQVARLRRRAGPIRRCRKMVAFIRKSGQRRDELLRIINEGNEAGLWTEFNVGGGTAVVALSLVTVLPDVKTRWDSVFYMLRRLRYLQQPIKKFFNMHRDAQSFSHPLENRHWNRLEILELILQPHTVQTIMSSENTPILAATIPAFELFLSAWEAMKVDQDLAEANVAPIITPGLNLAKSYYKKLDDSKAYILAMCYGSNSYIAQDPILSRPGR